MLPPWEKSYDQPRQHIKKQTRYFTNKGPSSQSYGFSSSHVWMWELNCKESWMPKNQCFWTVVLEKTLESPLDCKEIQPVHSEGDQPWDFFGRNDAKAETPVLWSPHPKNWLIVKDSDAGRDWGQEEKGTTEDEMAGWHHWLDGRESEWTPGVGDGQGGLAWCDSWGHRELDTTEQLNWTELSVQLFLTSWTIAHQAPLSMGFPRQEYWSGFPFRSLGDIPDPGIKHTSPVSPALAGRFFTMSHLGSPRRWINIYAICTYKHTHIYRYITANLKTLILKQTKYYLRSLIFGLHFTSINLSGASIT